MTLSPTSAVAAAGPEDFQLIARPLVLTAVASLALAACARDGDIDETGGISVTRSACLAVAVPANTGDVTLFDPATSRDARAIDVVATITNVRSTCATQGSEVVSNATFDIVARRRDAGAEREVVVPYFATVVRGGTNVVAKRLASVRLVFPAGQTRATGRGEGGAVIALADATLPPDVLAKLTRRRKAGEADASIDPLSAPDVRAAVSNATFELLVGIQLTDSQLLYNATR